ncbi:MAG: type II toxin-antitoxin system RelE/ParE family toxin [Gammaproteobacteria bacterium]|nr:type II toxin-antitoxin system RelE/ParE family toxin [Gammaproteobacteria bacterium]
MDDRDVLWTETARGDLEQIIAFIAESSPASAMATAERIEGRCVELNRLPARGRLVPELRAADVLAYRELVEGPWRIVNRYDDRAVYVVAVLDARRDLTSLLLARLVR